MRTRAVPAARLDAVSELCGEWSELEAFMRRKFRGKVPDLERLLLQVSALGSKQRAEEHPDSRARIFDADKVGGGD